MEKRRLGKSDLYVTPIGLGCRTLHKVEAEKAVELVRKAVEMGINFIDTANIYGGGRSEEIVGEAIRDLRKRVILATKGSIVITNEGLPCQDLKPESVKKAVEDSLKRLQTDYIDLYQIHYPDPETPPEETVKTLMEFIESGIIRYVGVSNFSLKELERWSELIETPSIQIPYNFLQRRMYDRILDFCLSRQISIIAYTPLLMGLLTEKIRDKDFIHSGERAHIPSRILEECGKIVDKLGLMGERHGMTAAQLILNWLANQPGIGCVLVGTSSIKHVKENIEGVKWRMPSSVKKMVDDLVADIEVDLGDEFFTQKVKKVFSNYAGKTVAILEIGMKFIVPPDVKAGDTIKINWYGEYLGKCS